MPVLKVPYFVQPTGTTCQATVLRMFASYIDVARGQPIQPRDIPAIKTTINSDPSRPNQSAKNAWANMHWWLGQEFPDMTFRMDTSTDTVTGIETIKTAIRNGSPVLVSTNQNMNSSGHIILVVGVMRLVNGRLEEPIAAPVGQDLVFVVHDPYGRFGRQYAPQSGGWGADRYEGGLSHIDGDEHGPGKGVIYTLDGIRRSNDLFLLIRAESIPRPF